MDERQRTPEEDEAEFIRRRGLFTGLTASDGWKELERILQAQHAGQLVELLSPPSMTTEADGMKLALMSEYRKGVVFGIQLTLKTPYATIASADDIIANRQAVEKDNANASRERSRTDSDGTELPSGAIVTDLSGGN